jgi:hypothetical protein
MGALGGVQSITGGPASVRAVFREGALAKSNMSSRGGISIPKGEVLGDAAG